MNKNIIEENIFLILFKNNIALHNIYNYIKDIYRDYIDDMNSFKDKNESYILKDYHEWYNYNDFDDKLLFYIN